MKNLNVELHTRTELKVGDKYIAEIKFVKNLNDELESKAVCIINQNGRRTRVLGYVSNIPQYTNVLSDQLVEAMDANNLEKVEVEVVKREKQQIDDRTIYLLAIDNEDITSFLLSKNVSIDSILENITEEINSSEENEISDVESTASNSTPNNILIERAISELSNKSLGVNSSEDKPFNLISVKLKVAGLVKDNPSKSIVTSLIKTGEQPKLELARDKEGKLRVVFDGNYAGEITENQPLITEINVEDVHSIKVFDARTLSYVIEVQLKEYVNDINLSVQENNNEESLFVEIMKPILTEVMDANNDVVLTAEDLKSNESLISEVWNIVNRIKGKSVEEKAYEIEVSSAVNTLTTTKNVENTIVPLKQVEEKKSRKADAEEIKKIATYLASNGISEKYINKIVKSYKEYPERYLERIPSIKESSFTPWKYNGKGRNLLELAIISIEMGKNLRLVGGKGAGKNTLLSTLSWIYQRPLFSQSANRDTDITHLFGDKTIDAVNVEGQVAQVVEFEKGLLIEAMEVGGFYEFGEGNACRAEVTMALHSVLDSRREADVNGYKLVKADDNFVFTLTMNVDYEGCNSLNQAFRDRFITIPFPSPVTIVPVLKQACPTARNRDIEMCDKVYTHILSRVEELQTDEIVTIRGYINALDLAKDISLKTALEMCVAYNVSDDELIIQEILEIIDSVVA